jgi:hypothetical protein
VAKSRPSNIACCRRLAFHLASSVPDPLTLIKSSATAGFDAEAHFSCGDSCTKVVPPDLHMHESFLHRPAKTILAQAWAVAPSLPLFHSATGV